MIIADKIKRESHRAGGHGFFFYRDNHGQEIDLVMTEGPSLDLIEIKSGQTAHPDLWRQMSPIRKALNHPGKDFVVYGGEGQLEILGTKVFGWKEWMLADQGD